jgi:6-phosphogluconolactonase (cycloisomerase 2 family)
VAKLLGQIGSLIGMKQIEDPTVTLAPGYCQLISNYYKQDGVWFQRNGATKVLGSATGNPIMGMKEVIWDDGSKSILVASGDKWYNGGSACSTLTAIKTQLTNNEKFDVAQYKISTGHAVITSRAFAPQKYDGTTLSGLTTSFTADFSSTNKTDFSTVNVQCFAIDPTNTYLYVGCQGTPGKIVKYDIDTGATIATITLASGENNVVSLAMDSTGTYLYAGCATNPGKIIKITLSTFAFTATKTLATNYNGAYSIQIDSTDTYLYIGCTGSPARICKLTLANFSTVATVDLGSGENAAAPAMVIDSADTYLYIGCDLASPGKIVKLTLADFTTMTTKTLASGENSTTCLAIDSSDTYLYMGCTTSPAKIVKLTLADFSTEVVKTLSTGENTPSALVIDSSGTYLYIGCNPTTTAVKIVRLTLSDFSTTTKTLAPTEVIMGGMIIDKLDVRIYAAVQVSASNNKVVELTLIMLPKFVEIHKSKSWLFGFYNDSLRVYAYYSKTLDATDYATANDAGALVFSTELSKLDTPMGLKSWGDYIVFMFKNTTLVYFAGTNPNDFKVIKKIENVGSLTRDVISVGQDIWFPTLFGIRSLNTSVFNGEMRYNDKSQDIDSFWSAKIIAYGTNTDRISMKYDKIRNQIMVLANDSANQGVCFYVYSVDDKVWSTYNIAGLGAGVSVTAFEITQDGLIYFGTSDGNIYQLFSGATDNTVAISYVIRLTTQYFGNSVQNKKVKYVRLGFDTAVTAGAISYDVDQKNVPRSTTAVVIPSSGTKGMLYSKLIPVQNRGKSWDFTFTNCGLIREILFYGGVEGEK